MNKSTLKDLPLAQLGRLQNAAFWLSLLLGMSWLIVANISRNFPNVLFSGMNALLLWAFTAALLQYLLLRFEAGDRGDVDNQLDEKRRADLGEPAILSAPIAPAFAQLWQWVVVAAAALVITGQLGYVHTWEGLGNASLAPLRWATAAYLALGCVLYFFLNFAAAVQRRLESHVLDSLLILTRLCFIFCLAAAAAVFVNLSTTRDFSAWLGWPALVLAIALVLEPLVRLALRFYQPKGLRQTPGAAGDSLVLDTVFGSGRELGSTLQYFESLAGMNLGDVWVFKFFRQTGLLILLGVVVFGWLSTCFTVVPVGSRGVRVALGRLDPVPLPPGLHLNLFWPLGRIEVVQTELIQSVSLGFDRDLDGPVLWSEKHVEGEKNLLIGDGEALLTINIPILYRISDPVAYLKTAADPSQALSDLAERKLLHVMGSRESFSVMIEDRQLIADTLRTDLQKELNDLHLGIELVYVGLRDVHPPVDVAPAYQEVISAQEEKQTLIDKALANRAQALPAAQSEATRLTLQSGAEYTDRVDQAEGSAARFTDLAAVDRESSDLFRTELRLQAMEDSLAAPNKILLGISSDRVELLQMDLR